MTEKTLLVTGGAGFIGSNYIAMLLEAEPDTRVVNLDALTYAGSPDNMKGFMDNPRHIFVEGDICDRTLVSDLFG